MGRGYKIALFYYTQTGQALAIADKICAPMVAAGCEVVRKEIRPEPSYPYPWTADGFLQVFPESRLAVASSIKRIDFGDVADADLVMVACQSWYLSLSVPLHSFFQSDDVRDYLHGRAIVVVNGCRNMWVMAQQKTREYIRELGGRYVGFIVMRDRAANLVSVVTIVRWLFYQRKDATRFLPAAGVSRQDIDAGAKFGQIILAAMQDGGMGNLQRGLIAAGAVEWNPGLYFLERNGHRLWGKWARFIRKKGGYMAVERRPYLRFFCLYMLFALYVVSPFGMLFFYLTYPFRKPSFDEMGRHLCYELN